MPLFLFCCSDGKKINAHKIPPPSGSPDGMQTRSVYVEGRSTARGHFRSRYSFEIEFLKTTAWNVKTQHKTKPKTQFLCEI